MSRSYCLALASALALAGCNQIDKKAAQVDGPGNPYYKLAQQDLDNGDPQKAAHDYEAALGVNPNLAGAHYQLGHLYGDKLNDPVGEIFHFEQYVRLAPSGDKIDEVKALIDKQSQAFAASLPNTPAQNADDYARLQADDVTLKKQIDDAAHTITQLQTALTKSQADIAQKKAELDKVSADREQLQAALIEANKHNTAPPPTITYSSVTAPVTGQLTSEQASQLQGGGEKINVIPPTGPGNVTAPPPATPGTVTPAPEAPSPETTPHAPPKALPLSATNVVTAAAAPAPGTPVVTPGPEAPSRTYTVVKGDKLWTIARKMYPGGNTKDNVEKIQDANKEALGDKPLKIGQVLIIP